MKAIAINGSPRKNWNTAQLLDSAQRGAASVGAQTELIHLYDLNYRGCVSCFGCKRKGAIPCRCHLNDDLRPVLERVLEADVLLLGSPIYFGGVTGQMRCFLERLAFITMSYDDYTQKVFPGHIDCAFFFTMNAGDRYEALYQPVMESNIGLLANLGGSTQYYAATDTLQFEDYSKYHAAGFSEKQKRRRRQEQFPKDLAAAFDIGKELAQRSR